MEELKKDKQFNLLKWIFVAVSIVHIVYATITMRGMYMDGSFYMLDMLNKFDQWQFWVSADTVEHPRFFISWLTQIPVMLSYSILFIKSKFALMMIYSFVLFAFPLLFLCWNYKLSQRTNRIDIFFWSLFCYCSILITYSIFSVVETIIGSVLHFILWNYLVNKIEYKKADILGIVFLILMMFATYEYVAYLGIIFFIASIYYASQETDEKAKYIKNMIGLFSLGASIYNILFMLNVQGEYGEIQRFIQEWILCGQQSVKLNLSISITTLGLLLYFLFNKNKFSNWTIGVLASLYVINFAILLHNPALTINPMMEGHFRIIPCVVVPIIFIVLFVFDLLKREAHKIKYSNFICIVLLCGITHTCWQMVNTYHWDKNIQYMKKELETSNAPLYIPSEHEPISSFHNEKLRKYIWHSLYSCTSILFSDTYEQKTLLMHYDEEVDASNHPCREFLYVVQNEDNKINIPFDTKISIKNRFWDLTKCAEALDEYNKEHNIKTEG